MPFDFDSVNLPKFERKDKKTGGYFLCSCDENGDGDLLVSYVGVTANRKEVHIPKSVLVDLAKFLKKVYLDD